MHPDELFYFVNINYKNGKYQQLAFKYKGTATRCFNCLTDQLKGTCEAAQGAVWASDWIEYRGHEFYVLARGSEIASVNMDR